MDTFYNSSRSKEEDLGKEKLPNCEEKGRKEIVYSLTSEEDVKEK